MACVTEQQKKSQEYRDAMKRFDITSDELEVILHKYQNDPKNQEAFSKGELTFPSDEYLQEQLSAPAITVSKESIIDYWNEHYSKPIVFDTLEDATRAEQEARSIVGSTKVRKTASGKYELTVGRPVKQQVSNNTVKVETYKGYWKREDVEKATDKVFLFVDNTEDRTVTHHVPTSTQAVIRGLPNAIGIDTKKNRGTSDGLSIHTANAEFYSGGAEGADKAWAKASEEAGINVINYTVNNWDKLPDDVKQALENEYLEVVHLLGRRELSKDSYSGKLVRRDMMQADKADAIFAVGTIGNNGYIDGGTGYASTRGILRGIPVYLFDQKDGVWKVWNNGKFIPTNKPQLTNHAAVIGTRQLQDNGKAAINSLFERGGSSYFTDADFDQFKAQVDEAIQKAIDSGKTIVLPSDGIGTGKAQLKERAPKLFAYLQEQLNKLQSGELTKSTVEQPVSQEQETENNTKLSSRDQAFYDNQRKLSTSIDNLIGIDSVFSNSEIDEAAQDVAFNLSYMITQMQENPSLITETFGIEINKDDVSKLSRLDLVKKIGLQNLLDYCRISMFNPLKNNAISDEMVDKAFLLLEEKNFNTLVLKCNSTFAFIEGWGIKLNEVGKAEVDENVDTSNEDNFNESQNTTEVAETQGNAQEHWQVDTNTLSVISTMSQQIKQFLANCYKLDKEGNQVLSAWGVPQRMNVSEATAQILSWTQGSLNRPQMVKLLTKHADSNPWINQVLERLNDASGDNAIFQAQFFNSFARHHQSYAVATLENGSYVTKIINTSSALKDAFKNIESAYKIGQHPLFTSKGVNSTTYGKLISINDELSHLKYSEEEKEHIANLLADASTTLGYPATKEQILEILDEKSFKAMTSDSLKYIVSLIGANKNNPTWEPFSRNPKKQGILNNIGRFIKPLTDILEATTIHSFYSKGKMYQSDVLPSYLSDMLDSFNKDDKVNENNPAEPTEFAKWLNHEFGRYSQFRDASRDKGNLNEDLQRGWRNEWLRLLVTDPKARELLDHKVQLTFNNHSYMLSESDSQAMLDNEYLLSVVTEYFSETNWEKQESLVPAWFKIPMMSNKASAEYIRFYSYRGNGYQDEITKGLKQFFDYELSRIQTVRMRDLNKDQVGYIDQLDENGKRFCFLPFLNKYVEGKENSKLGTLIEKKVSGEELTTEEEAELNDLALKAIKYEMNLIAKNKLQQWQRDGIVDAAIKSIKGITKENAIEQLENFIWNDMFAAKNILQLTITDIAQYKGAEDLQKRLKELQAPGTKADIFATDFNGDRVSDGINRTLYISDISGEAVKSDLIENLRIVFNNKLALLDPNSRDYAIAKQTYDEILRQYAEDINVTDGQAYSSLSSMRKKMFMFGKWSREAEDFYNKVKAGHWDHTDFQTHFNPLKPFTYSQTSKSTGVDNAPISNFKLGVQNKNSEYMLLIAGAILEESGQPNILQVLSDVMEDSVKKVSADKCLDSIQFESAVKTGITGVIDITSFINKPNGAEALKTYLESRIYNDDGTYNALHVHELNYEDFKIQQDIPDHFIDHFQAWGSQIRMITPSDLDINSSFTYTDGTTQVTKNGAEFRKEYEKNAAENIQESLDEVVQEFNLDGTPLERNIALARILQREILSSPRYGMDLLVACSLNENGEFRIPLNDPIQSKRIEQLLNSIIKNRVNKQEIAGGPVVQVTNFGTSRRLHIRFNDKQGNLLKNLEEYQAEGHSEEEWKKYIEENQGGIAYYEVYAPATHRRFFEDFTDENGVIDVKAIEKLNPDLLKMIGYRIPTEDKYSTFPCKIVGFMPSEAGEALMMPYEITLITGSDYDIDKMYLMLKELPISRKKNVREEMFKAIQSSRKQWYEKQGKKMPYEENKKLGEQVNDFLSNPLRMSRYGKTDPLYRAMSHWYRNNAFECEIPLSGRSYRNNKVVDMTWSVLTHPDVAAQVLKPGGFDPEKRIGYLAEAMRLGNKYEDIKDLSISKLKKLCTTGKDLTDISTHVQFYKQNSAAGALLAIFATAKIAHATLAGNGYRININEVCRTTQPFYIDGIAFDGLMEFDAQKNRDGSYIGLELGSLVASAADAVKDPILNLMNINNNTVNILNAMLRMGIPFETAALMLSSKIVGDTLKEYSQIVLDPKKKTSFAKLLKDKFNNLNKQISGKDTSETPSTTKIDSKLDYEDLTKEEMIEAITKNNLNVDYKIILALMRFSSIANSLRTPSAISKLNSINSAVGPLVIDNIIMQNQLTSEMLGLYDSSGNELTMGRIFADHLILEKFYGGYQIAERVFQPISIAASTGFNNAIEGTFGHIVKGNRKLLNNFLEFYKSYMMLVGDVINEDKVSYYINEFPAKLHKAKSDSRYADNRLIQAIKFSSSNSGRVVANIDTTGLQSKDKDLLSGAWIDLYKKDPELATDLFNYCFFKGGIGFNPKAFMGLLPAQLKEQFSSYIETLRKLPSTSEYSHIIRDQFVQHNAKDNSLVPIVEAKNIHTKGNEMILDDEDVASTGYVKTREDGKYKLFKVYERRDSAGNIEKILTELPLLGNNGEFLEISLSPKKSSIGNEGILQIENGSEEQQQGIQDTDVEDIQKDMETDELSSQDMAISQEQASDDAIVAGTLIYNALNPQDKVKIRTLKDIKINEPERFTTIAEAMRGFFRSKAAELGLKVNDKQIEEMLNMFC